MSEGKGRVKGEFEMSSLASVECHSMRFGAQEKNYLRKEDNFSFEYLLKKNLLNPSDTLGAMPGAGDSEANRSECSSQFEIAK